MGRLTIGDVEDRLQKRGIKHLLETNQPFRRFVWTILQDAGIHGETHVPGHPDTSAFAEGRRALGLLILHTLEQVDPDVLPLLWKEGRMLTQITQTSQQQEAQRANLPQSLDDDDFEDPPGS